MDTQSAFAEIGLLSYEGSQTAAVLGMTDMLTSAAQIARRRQGEDGARLVVSHWARAVNGGGPERVFLSPGGQDLGQPTAIVIPPGLGDPMSGPDARFHADWLRSRHSRGATLCSICKGAFLLGETGLLDGRTVTTHWSYEEQLLARFPAIRVNSDRLIIDDGDILTAGGVMAWIDLSLILIERFLGNTVMIETARAFLVDPPGREQSYYSSFSPRLNHGDDAILKVQHWLRSSGGKDMNLTAMADQAGLEPRTFMRRFQKATGHTAGEYVQRLRVDNARDLLQFTRDGVDAVAWKVHYTDPGSFRKVFTRIVGLTPAEYRQRFLAPPLASGLGVARRSEVLR